MFKWSIRWSLRSLLGIFVEFTSWQSSHKTKAHLMSSIDAWLKICQFWSLYFLRWEIYVVSKGFSTYFETLKLWKGRSGWARHPFVLLLKTGCTLFCTYLCNFQKQALFFAEWQRGLNVWLEVKLGLGFNMKLKNTPQLFELSADVNGFKAYLNGKCM